MYRPAAKEGGEGREGILAIIGWRRRRLCSSLHNVRPCNAKLLSRADSRWTLSFFLSVKLARTAMSRQCHGHGGTISQAI